MFPPFSLAAVLYSQRSTFPQLTLVLQGVGTQSCENLELREQREQTPIRGRGGMDFIVSRIKIIGRKNPSLTALLKLHHTHKIQTKRY